LIMRNNYISLGVCDWQFEAPALVPDEDERSESGNFTAEIVRLTRVRFFWQVVRATFGPKSWQWLFLEGPFR